MENLSEFLSCDALDRMANWVGMNFATAFVASLERCYCINLRVVELDLEEDDEAINRSLMISEPKPSIEAAASASDTSPLPLPLPL